MEKEISSKEIGINETPNQISDEYEILTGRKIYNLTSEFATAYEVEDLIAEESNLYALLFNKNFPVRLEEITTLMKSQLEEIASPRKIAVITTDGEEKQSLVAILKKPAGRTIRQLVEQQREFDSTFVVENVIKPLSEILHNLHEKGIVHGCINPDTIYVDGENKICLENCISELPGFSQPAFYETPSKAQANNYAKGFGKPTDDYYALGMVVFYMLSGIEHRDSKQNIIASKLSEGTYAYLNMDYILSGVIGDLIRGLVVDDEELRFQHKELMKIIQGNQKDKPVLKDTSHLPQHIAFSQEEYYTKASLAYAFSLNKEEAKEFIKSEKVIKWLKDHDPNASELLEKLKLEMKQMRFVIPFELREDLHLTKTILVLNPSAPIIFRDTSFYKDGIGSLLAKELTLGKTQMFTIFQNRALEAILGTFEQLTLKYKSSSHSHYLKTLRKLTKQKLNRQKILYTLNPYLPYQSEFGSQNLCFGMRDILTMLENSETPLEELSAENDLIGFVQSKIDKEYTSESSNPLIVKEKNLLNLIAHAGLFQKDLNDQGEFVAMHSFTFKVAEYMKGIIQKLLHSQTLIEQMTKEIDEVVNEGNIYKLLQASLLSPKLAQDASGYKTAILRSRDLTDVRANYENDDEFRKEAREKVLRIALNIAYIVFILSLFSSMMKYI